jgi:hypothetical protein
MGKNAAPPTSEESPPYGQVAAESPTLDDPAAVKKIERIRPDEPRSSQNTISPLLYEPSAPVTKPLLLNDM